MTQEEKQRAIDLRRATDCSCVVCRDGRMTEYRERGVRDLLRLLREPSRPLDGAFVADKVVGKGAAALMVLGGVRELFAEVVSRPALELLRDAGVPAAHAQVVPHIINRAGTGVCPVETLCADCRTAAGCLPLIERFVAETEKPEKTMETPDKVRKK